MLQSMTQRHTSHYDWWPSWKIVVILKFQLDRPFKKLAYGEPIATFTDVF